MAHLYHRPRHHLGTRPLLARLRAASALAALCVLGTTGCADDGNGEFTISGIEQHEDCLSTASPLRPEMLAARERVNTIGLFMQTDFRLPSTSDLVYFEVYQPDYVRSRLGEPIELADPLELFKDDFEFDEPPVVRGQMLFAETCPEVLATFALRGTVIFHELGAEDGDVVRGELIDGEIINPREETVVARQVNGTWRYTVDQIRPKQHFPTFRDEIPRGPVP